MGPNPVDASFLRLRQCLFETAGTETLYILPCRNVCGHNCVTSRTKATEMETACLLWYMRLNDGMAASDLSDGGIFWPPNVWRGTETLLA